MVGISGHTRVVIYRPDALYDSQPMVTSTMSLKFMRSLISTASVLLTMQATSYYCGVSAWLKSSCAT